MTHQIKTTACLDLLTAFTDAKKGLLRYVKVIVNGAEELVVASSAPPIGKWEKDYDQYVLSCLADDQPCYIFYRTDSRQPDGNFSWLFISYNPEQASRQKKMMHALSSEKVKKTFGESLIKADLTGTTPDDVNFEAYMQYLKTPPPLTEAEKQLQNIRLNEAAVQQEGVKVTVKGVAFPVSPDAVAKLNDLKSGSCNYVQLSLNTSSKIIELEISKNVNLDELRKLIPQDHPRYHFYSCQHTYKGKQFKSTVFIYSVAEDNCPIKERVLYSTGKAPLLKFAEEQVGLSIIRRIEMSDSSELTDEFLISQIHAA